MYKYSIFLSTISSGLRLAHEVMLANREDMSMPGGQGCTQRSHEERMKMDMSIPGGQGLTQRSHEEHEGEYGLAWEARA